MGDADLGELLDQRDGFLQLGDARGDHDAVERGARGARLLHQPLAAQLQLPQVGVEEQRVELHRAPRVSAAQCPALAAAATIFASTVVGVMPASRIGERPVSRVKAVSTTMRPLGRRTGLGA
ncbi:Uncharacterised protein [Mycobacteroides abscessus subsp. abscessus]|nr:Uncharacterised protein [Mycobacteroides abscessus subsp. abscessus]